MQLPNWRASLWLLLSTVILPAALAISVGILILVFYRESWDVAFGVLVLCFAVFAIVGATITVILLRRAGRLAQLQSDFIARMSHDFRTPLTSIRMFVDTLRSGKIADGDERDRCLELLAQETERMRALVEQVLVWRHVERTPAYELAPAPPGQLVEEALAPFVELEPQAASRLSVVVEPELPPILVDRRAVVEAVRNLAANALQHGEGPVAVTVRGEGRAIAFSVRDNGPEIPRRERKRIFRRFYRADRARQGTGLGLAIAKSIARGHKGELQLDATADGGNIFTLRLPLGGEERTRGTEAR